MEIRKLLLTPTARALRMLKPRARSPSRRAALLRSAGNRVVAGVRGSQIAIRSRLRGVISASRRSSKGERIGIDVVVGSPHRRHPRRQMEGKVEAH